jgi:hypothetical protein
LQNPHQTAQPSPKRLPVNGLQLQQYQWYYRDFWIASLAAARGEKHSEFVQAIGIASTSMPEIHLFNGPENAPAALPILMPSKTVDRFPHHVERNGCAVSDAAEPAERRKRARMEVHWPLCFSLPGTAGLLETVTHNLSSDGFYCLAGTIFIPGEIRECTLGVPTHHPHCEVRVLPLKCKVRVIRVEALGGNGLFGVGCRIEDYRFAGGGNGSA